MYVHMCMYIYIYICMIRYARALASAIDSRNLARVTQIPESSQ